MPRTAHPPADRPDRPGRRSDADRGSATLEHLGIVVVAALLVVAVVTAVARADVGRVLACELRSIATQAGTCGGTDVPTTYGGAPAAAAGDAGRGSPGDVDAPAPGGVGAGGPEDAATKTGGDPAEGDDDTRYANASDDRPAVDAGAVEDAAEDLEDALDGGFFGVRGGDLEDARDAVARLDGPEIDALVAGLSDEEIEEWVEQLEDGWLQGGWDREQRRELWELFAARASRATLDRLAGVTPELQPAFDGVGGDGARDDPESPAASGRYGEIPHSLVIGGIAPQDASQGQIGDCWYIASMMAVAQADPSVLERAITLNDNGTYTVRLHDDGESVDVTVTPEMVLDDGVPAFVQGSRGEAGYELWPMVLEKALALHWGDFADIEGDSPGLGLEVLTGRESDSRDLDDAGGVDALALYLSDGGAVTLATFTESDDNPGLYDVSPAEGGLASNHAYYVSDVDTEEGTVTVTNPWGSGWPTVTMTYAEFEESFSQVYFNEVSR